MSERWVIDASIGIAWVHPAQATVATANLRQQLRLGVTLVVPVIWFQELANALLVLERRKKLTADERREALAGLSSLNTSPDHDGLSLVFGRVSDLADSHGLSVYDASYLELAMRERLPLGSKDAPLQIAARKCGVRLLLK